MRVPLIIRRPMGLKTPREVEGPVSLADVYPTVLDLLDFEVPEGIRGQSVGSSEMLLVN
jgi:arylsulfatase A-like enzyme